MKKTYEIEASEKILNRIDRFLGLLHWNSRHGHTGIFAMPLDGDGSDKVTVSPVPDYKQEVDLLAGVRYDIEVTYDSLYSGLFKDYNRTSNYVVKSVPSLIKDGVVQKMQF